MKKIRTTDDFLEEIASSIDRQVGGHTGGNTSGHAHTNANTTYRTDVKMDELIRTKGRAAVFGSYRQEDSLIFT